jgi:diguanylate cyclase (GGDEF)-like protein
VRTGALWIAVLLAGALGVVTARAAPVATDPGYRVELLDIDATADALPPPTTPARPKPRSLPYRDHGSWLRIVVDRLPAEARVVVESQAADDVTLVLPDGTRRVRNKLHPDSDADASPLALVFPLPARLAPGAMLYLHVKHRHLALTNVMVLDRQAWMARERTTLVVAPMLLSALLSFALASLCVWLVVRERMYLYYAAFLLTWLAYSASNTGLLYTVPGTAWIAALGIHAQWAIVSVTFAMSIGFAAGFLDLGRLAPRLVPWFDGARRVLLAAALVILASPWYLPAYGMTMSAVALTMYPALVAVGAYVAFTTRDRYAVYFLVGWIPMAFGTTLRALQVAGLVEVGSAITYFYTVGVLLQAVVLMGGLADRLLRTRRERDAARLSADRDELTGAYNRRHLLEIMAHERERAERHGHPFSLCILDIDHFKAINDNYGHATGDVVLRELARRIGAELRSRDRLGRWGGEEFVVLLPDAGIEDARAMSERVRRMVAEQPVAVGAMEVPATLSIGLAVFDPIRDDASTLVARADAALYRAKAGGRNRVESAALEAAGLRARPVGGASAPTPGRCEFPVTEKRRG